MAEYIHQDNKYFRLGLCLNCQNNTFHLPLDQKQSSGSSLTVWQCEHCKFENRVLTPIKDEIEVFAEYVRKRYM